MVNVRKYFLQRSLTRVMVDEFLAKQFYTAEYAGVEITKTPIGTRVIIYAGRPAVIIGRGGKTIKQLAQLFEKYFGLENPQITVTQVENPELNARVMAFRLAQALEKGYHFRRAAFVTIRRIMNAGAVGAEVIVSGKLSTERAKYEKLKEGVVYKTGGQLTQIVDRAVAVAMLKPGVYGVEVIITKPVRSVDKIMLKEQEQVPPESVTVTNVRFIEESSQQTQQEGGVGGS
jgi:small subunit ribosomal protein S3